MALAVLMMTALIVLVPVAAKVASGQEVAPFTPAFHTDNNGAIAIFGNANEPGLLLQVAAPQPALPIRPWRCRWPGEPEAALPPGTVAPPALRPARFEPCERPGRPGLGRGAGAG